MKKPFNPPPPNSPFPHCNFLDFHNDLHAILTQHMIFWCKVRRSKNVRTVIFHRTELFFHQLHYDHVKIVFEN